MVIKNIHTGKEYPTTKKKWDSMTPKYKKSFEVVDSTDKEEDIVVDVVPEMKEIKISKLGEKKIEKPITGDKKINTQKNI